MQKYSVNNIISYFILFVCIIIIINAFQWEQTEDFSQPQCTDPNASYVNGICYSCPQGLVFDKNTLQCTSNNTNNTITSTTNTTVPNSNNTTNTTKYKCYNEHDTLVGNTCYECIGKNTKLNSTTLQCENIKDAYYPFDAYIPTQDSACKSGYVLDSKMNACYKCKPNDIIQYGICKKIESVKPNDSYPAIKDYPYPFGLFF